MSNFFILIYRIFLSNKLFFYLFLTGSILFIVVFASQIDLEENISQSVKNPSDSTSFNEVIDHFKFADKLIVNISYTDTSKQGDQAKLAEFAERFLDSLKVKFDSGYITSVQGKVADSAITFWFSYIYQHLPFYLDEKDYEKIAERIRHDSVSDAVRKDYNTLVSPAGFAMKTIIQQDPLGLGFIALNKMKSLQNNENYVISDGFLFTRDLKNLLIFITPANPSSETSKNSKLIYGIDKTLEQLCTASGSRIKASCFGSVAVSVGNAQQLKQDILVTITIAMALIVLFLGFYFRSIKIPLLGFLPAVFGGGFALAVMYLVKGHISVIALGIGSVILGLIIDYALYFINQFRKKGDTEAVLKEMSLTIVLCCLTSAGAFLCLIFLRSAVLNDLGWFAALSVTGAAIFALAILPQMLTVKDSKKWRKPGSFMFVDRIAGVSYENKTWLVVTLLLLGTVSLFYFRRAGFEEDMMSLNFMTPKLRQAEAEAGRITDVSLKNIYIVSTSTGTERSLRMQEQVQARLQFLKERKIIRTFNGTGSVILSDSMQRSRIRMWNDFWTEDRKKVLKANILEAAGKYKFRNNAFDPFFDILEKKFEPLDKEGNEYAISFWGKDWVTENDGRTMIGAIAKVKQEDKDKVYSAFTGIPGIIIFDRQSLTNRFVENVKHDFELLVSLSMIFVTLLLLLSFGRIELALITAFPMFFSWLLTLGFMGLTGIKFNIFNIIISSFVFGLGVDYSIIMMRALQHRYKYGTSDIDTYKVSVFLSSATTLFGVAALFFARHPALNSIALISVVGVSVVVLTSYTFQPLLANWFFLSRVKKGTFPVTARIFIKTIVTWGNITLIGIIMMLTGIVLNLLPVKRKKKETWFHSLFAVLSRAYIAVTFPVKRKLINPNGEDFSKPAIIISNHQSLIETPAFLRLHPKIIILTNDWVWNSYLFGPVARLASFYNLENGIDSILDQLKARTEEGYSILVFPEAHRSTDHRIQRFHRGAFYMAEKLHLDILPVVVFGSGEFLPRGAFWGRPNALYMKILGRVTPEDMGFGSTYSERTRRFRKFYIDLYREFKAEFGTTGYYRRVLILNYVLKGPILEWYLRIKMRLSSNYDLFNKIVPPAGKILDIGCGYGFISYLLSLTGENRSIMGIDHDPEKIEVAKNCFLKNDRIGLICSDINTFTIEDQDVFIFSDVLHYLTVREQEDLLKRCIEKLNPGGIILIRDADIERAKKHRGTRLTEFFSTRILGFNKTGKNKELFFTSVEKLRSIALSHQMSMEVIQESKHTSNLLIIIRHKKN
jgi:uncharacterized protein